MLYHDAIYDPTAASGRNEELSAQLAEGELPDILAEHRVHKVARYVRATASHAPAERDDDLNFFLDADLVILGSDPDRYDQYARDIRWEYAHVPDDQYREGRTRVLQSLAARAGQSSLFKTTVLGTIYEEPAQQNIAREIQLLAA